MKWSVVIQGCLGVALFLTTAVAPVLAAEGDAIALKQELAEAKAQIKDLKAKLTEVLAEQAQLRARLAARDAELNKAVKGVEERLTRKEWHEPLRGKVKSVDKEAGTLVINMGERHEVKKGSAFIVFRGDQYVGKVIVDEVRPDECTAHLDRDSMKEAPQAGDDVTTKLVIEL